MRSVGFLSYIFLSFFLSFFEFFLFWGGGCIFSFVGLFFEFCGGLFWVFVLSL